MRRRTVERWSVRRVPERRKVLRQLVLPALLVDRGLSRSCSTIRWARKVGRGGIPTLRADLGRAPASDADVRALVVRAATTRSTEDTFASGRTSSYCIIEAALSVVACPGPRSGTVSTEADPPSLLGRSDCREPTRSGEGPGRRTGDADVRFGLTKGRVAEGGDRERVGRSVAAGREGPSRPELGWLNERRRRAVLVHRGHRLDWVTGWTWGRCEDEARAEVRWSESGRWV